MTIQSCRVILFKIFHMCGCDMDETEDMRMTTVVKEKGGSRSKTFDMVYIAVFAVLIAICS